MTDIAEKKYEKGWNYIRIDATNNTNCSKLLNSQGQANDYEASKYQDVINGNSRQIYMTATIYPTNTGVSSTIFPSANGFLFTEMATSESSYQVNEKWQNRKVKQKTNIEIDRRSDADYYLNKATTLFGEKSERYGVYDCNKKILNFFKKDKR